MWRSRDFERISIRSAQADSISDPLRTLLLRRFALYNIQTESDRRGIPTAPGTGCKLFPSFQHNQGWGCDAAPLGWRCSSLSPLLIALAVAMCWAPSSVGSTDASPPRGLLHVGVALDAPALLRFGAPDHHKWCASAHRLPMPWCRAEGVAAGEQTITWRCGPFCGGHDMTSCDVMNRWLAEQDGVWPFCGCGCVDDKPQPLGLGPVRVQVCDERMDWCWHLRQMPDGHGDGTGAGESFQGAEGRGSAQWQIERLREWAVSTCLRSCLSSQLPCPEYCGTQGQGGWGAEHAAALGPNPAPHYTASVDIVLRPLMDAIVDYMTADAGRAPSAMAAELLDGEGVAAGSDAAVNWQMPPAAGVGAAAADAAHRRTAAGGQSWTVGFHMEHDAALALAVDGEVVIVLELERMTRIRYFDSTRFYGDDKATPCTAPATQLSTSLRLSGSAPCGLRRGSCSLTDAGASGSSTWLCWWG